MQDALLVGRAFQHERVEVQVEERRNLVEG
jgi:hypothetical protein